MVRVNPLLGLGPANYYSYAPGFPILGFSVRFSSHNNYIDLIAQTGYLGLACFVWFATAMGVLCRRIIRRVPSGFAKAYAYGALGGLAGTLVSGMLGDWFLPFVYNVGIDGLGASLFAWLFMGGLVALGRLVLTREESLAPTPDLA
jgi:O-antigen ligase